MWRPQTKEAVLREVRIREWRARLWHKVKTAARRVLKSVAATCVAVVCQLRAWSAATAHEVELNRRLSQRYDKLLRLGEQAYALYRSGNRSFEVLVPLCEEIARLEGALESARTQPLVVVTDDRPATQPATGS